MVHPPLSAEDGAASQVNGTLPTPAFQSQTPLGLHMLEAPASILLQP